MVDKKITSIADLILELKSLASSGKGPIWYRGHANAKWELKPHYDRLKKPINETELFGRFRQNANLLLTQPPTKPNDFGWMFLMQHYGVPTRLLDWTESPLVALYFAIDDKNPDNLKRDAALWVLYPNELNKHSTAESSYIPSFEDEWLANYSVEQYSKGKDNGILPIAAIATRNNPRIQAQLGVFTISHLKKVAVEKVEDGKHCVKLVIPKESKAKLKEELRTLGISRFQIFPELSSIGESLKEELM
jgi:hypothetical protein